MTPFQVENIVGAAVDFMIDQKEGVTRNRSAHVVGGGELCNEGMVRLREACSQSLRKRGTARYLVTCLYDHVSISI